VLAISDRPEFIKRDELGRLHAIDSPAIKYRDGWSIYCVHGVSVPDWIIEKRSDITSKKIDDEQNAEVRRIMIDFYGTSRYLQDSGAMQIHKDKYGILYRKKMEGDEDILMVRVFNSTPEPDSSFKEYWLRVPPNTKTAWQAVAWTFGITENPKEYKPEIET
jgi:hypothetical protein